MTEKKPKYIEGVGWRYDTGHNQKRRHKKHRYNDVGTYLVTIVVEGRMSVFGSISGSPATVLSPLGLKVLNEDLPKIHAIYPMVEVWKPICIMPDHLHLIIRINSPLPPQKHLGTIVSAFKGGVTRAWHAMMNDRLTPAAQGQRLTPAAQGQRLTPAAQGQQLTPAAQGQQLAPAAQGQRLTPAVQGQRLTPLFEDNYNDRILMCDGQLKNWKAYLNANPYRWFVMHTRPDLMQRSLCVVIGGIRYGAFGNFMLLRHPEKVQVFFHRKMVDDRLTPAAQGQTSGWRPKIPTEQTLFWQKEHARLMEIAEQGDVLVTPGISECEKRIKNECISNLHRLIHIQDKPIGRYWKPEKSRFEACAAGTLLILAPWAEDLEGDSDYARFHNLNTLAASVCTLDADTAMQVTGGRKTTGWRLPHRGNG
ncbi:MAG: hypothetical protein KBT04_02610 [Bacteroidales bacterium]|nr:hypothetical protein [Candidatus Colimorpha onthohippi]